MDLPEIFQLPEGRLDFYLDELALPVPELAAPLLYDLREREKEKGNDTLTHLHHFFTPFKTCGYQCLRFIHMFIICGYC